MALSSDKTEEAKKEYTRLAETAQLKRIRFVILTRLALFTQDKAELEKLYIKCSELIPPEGANILAKFYFDEKRFEDVIKLTDSLNINDRTLLATLLAAESAAAVNNVQKIKEYREAIQARDRSTTVIRYYLKAMISFMEKDYNATLEALSYAQEFAPRTLAAYMKFTSLVNKKAHVSLIIEAAKALHNAEPALAGTVKENFVNIIKVLVTGKYYSDALLAADFLSSLPGGIPKEAYDDILTAFDALERRNSLAVDTAAKCIELNPKHLTANKILAFDQISRNNIKGAKKHLDAILAVDPDSQFALTASAAIEESTGNKTQAEALLKKTFETAETNKPGAADNYFKFLMKNNKTAEASALADKCYTSEDIKLKAAACIFKSIIAASEKDNAKTVEYIREAEKIAPDDPVYPIYLSDLAETPEEAEKILVSAIARVKNNAILQRKLAALYASQGKKQESENIYANLLKEYPDDTLTLINFSELLAASGKTREAYEYAVKARETAPKAIPVRECCAAREIEQGNYRQAILDAEYVLAAQPENIRAKRILAYALAADAMKNIGDTENHDLATIQDAEKQIRKALSILPDNPLIKKAADDLEAIRKKAVTP